MIVWQLMASLAALAGLLAVYFTWQRRGVREGIWRYGLPGGWTLIVAGLTGWALSTHIDQGLALGSVAIMTFAGIILCWQGLKLMGQPAKVQRERETQTDTLALGTGYWGRFATRFLGSLLVAPAFGVLIGLAWRAYAPGNEADKLIWLAIIATLAMTGGVVYQLASRRPYRACGLLTVAGLVIAAGVYLPLIGSL
jgi:hypothetical protein